MFKHLSIALVAAALLSPAAPAHAASPTVFVFDTVDAIGPHGVFLVVTGILAGNSAPSTMQFRMVDDKAPTCLKLGLIAMSKPGKYQLSIDTSSFTVDTCSLAVRAP